MSGAAFTAIDRCRLDEIAATVLFLACDAASLTTGSVPTVDGGCTCR